MLKECLLNMQSGMSGVCVGEGGGGASVPGLYVNVMFRFYSFMWIDHISTSQTRDLLVFVTPPASDIWPACVLYLCVQQRGHRIVV